MRRVDSINIWGRLSVPEKLSRVLTGKLVGTKSVMPVVGITEAIKKEYGTDEFPVFQWTPGPGVHLYEVTALAGPSASDHVYLVDIGDPERDVDPCVSPDTWYIYLFQIAGGFYAPHRLVGVQNIPPSI